MRPRTRVEWWHDIEAAEVEKGIYSSLPKVGDRCLFERTDGYFFYGHLIGNDYAWANLYQKPVPVLSLRSWAPVDAQNLFIPRPSQKAADA